MSEVNIPKCIVLQRVIPAYRVAVFRRLSSSLSLDISFAIGEDLKESKARNAADLAGIQFIRLTAYSLNLFGRDLTVHRGLIRHLRDSKPDIILCEAESHFLAYWTAIVFKIIFSQRTKLVMWCFYGLPGVKRDRTFLHAAIKSVGRFFFNSFVSYTTYGKNYLIAKGYGEQRIHVAVNVCDTSYFLELDYKLNLSKEQAKDEVGAKGKFVVSYVGTLDESKRPGLILDISKILDGEDFHFQIVGEGPLKKVLTKRVLDEGLTSVRLVGRVSERLPLYYRSSDLVILPGRGGVVISESMCFGVPVIVHQADGVESDLVINGVTGIISESGSADVFCSHLRNLKLRSDILSQMGKNARVLISEKFNTEAMFHSIVKALGRAVRLEL